MGGVYLSDYSSHSIQHISPDGTVTVIAGQGAKVGFDGALTEAAFIHPSNISAPGNGLIYVLDNWRIRKIDIAAKTITSVANREDVSIANESSDYWNDFIVTPSGDFYFANFPRNCLSRLTATGQWSILAGVAGESEIRDGSGAAARFGNLHSLTADAAGNLYVADSITGQTIRRISPGGVVTTIAGSPTSYTGEAENNGDGLGTAARFNTVSAIAATPTGGLWIGDFALLRYMAPSGEVTTIAGTPGTQVPGGPDGQGESVVFNHFQDLVPIDDRAVLILEGGTNRVRRATLDRVVDTVPLQGPYDVQNKGFAAMAYVAGRHYVVDQNNRRLLAGMITEDHGRLANLSVLKRVGDSGETLTAGFVIEGDVAQPMLIRAVGPTLAHFGIESGFMPNPEFTVFDRDSNEIDRNDNWTESSDIIETMQRLGAFPLDSGSLDAALVRVIPNGPTTAMVGPADEQAGQVLVEVYDADLAADTRLTNLSTRTNVGPGEGRLIVGFVITGENAKTVLIRGIGPALTQYGFSSGDVLRDPHIRLFKGSTLIAENDDWADEALLDEAFSAIGAFTLPEANSKDASLLIQLPPGAYSVHLESVDGHSGAAIAEVYEVK